jgi:translation initiation factor IF-3
MLIGANGEKIGVISFDKALESAKEISLDLVQVSPSNASPVVCKILDYGKHLFDKKKSTTGSKVKKVKETVSKKLNLDHQQILVTIKLN